MKVILAGRAKADLREIGLFIARGNKIHARVSVQQLRARALEIGIVPTGFPVGPRAAFRCRTSVSV